MDPFGEARREMAGWVAEHAPDRQLVDAAFTSVAAAARDGDEEGAGEWLRIAAAHGATEDDLETFLAAQEQ